MGAAGVARRRRAAAAVALLLVSACARDGDRGLPRAEPRPTHEVDPSHWELCDLLTAAEVEAVVGAPSTAVRVDDSSSWRCRWSGERGSVFLRVEPFPLDDVEIYDRIHREDISVAGIGDRAWLDHRGGSSGASMRLVVNDVIARVSLALGGGTDPVGTDPSPERDLRSLAAAIADRLADALAAGRTERD